MSLQAIQTREDLERLEKERPFESLCQFESTYEAIRTSAHLRPEKTALSFFLNGNDYRSVHTIDYQSLLQKITQTANFFHRLGLQCDDVVAFILPNMPETHYVLWGGEARCQILAINPLLEPGQIRELIASVDAKAVITMNPMSRLDLWPKLDVILPELPSVQHVIGVDIAHYVNGAKGMAARLIQSSQRKKITLPAGKQYYNFTQAITKENGNDLMFDRDYTQNTISSLFCTGGTTGLPKIARRTHRNELANARSLQMLNADILNANKVILGGLPLFHVNGALATGLLPFMIGASIVIATPQGYRGEGVISRFWEIVEYFRVSAFSAVPTVYSALMNIPIEGRDLSSLEVGICGAAPMPVELFRSFQERTGIKILEGYGLTEGTCVSSINLFHGQQKIGSIGVRLPYQDMVCAVVDADRIVRICETDEIGVLAIKGPNISLGYQLEHQNKDLWMTDEHGDTWLNTGDLARQDADGYFWLTGRKKELIVRGGHNIEPKLIEESLCRHPAVNMAAAVGKPDAHAGEVPVCYVQISDATTINVEELLTFAAKETPEKAAIPKEIHMVEELPLTAVGKVFKPQLEMQEIERCILTLATHNLPDNSIKVAMKQDPKHGILAEITLIGCDAEQQAIFRKELGAYTFKHTFIK